MRGLPLRGATLEASQLTRAEAAITPANLLRHITELSSDAYTGRAPGTEGEIRSVAYLIAQCKEIGLEPGNQDGSWTQKVALWGTLTQDSTLQVQVRGKEMLLVAGQDYVAWSALPAGKVDVVSSGVVFGGYGVVAPEYRWDDYAGSDIHGKTVVLLSGDPPVVDPSDPSRLNEKIFLGRALTVYGRTGTKLETAFRHGAAAVILVSATSQASPAQFQNYTREVMTLRGPGERDRVQAQALLGLDRAATLVFGGRRGLCGDASSRGPAGISCRFPGS